MRIKNYDRLSHLFTDFNTGSRDSFDVDLDLWNKMLDFYNFGDCNFQDPYIGFTGQIARIRAFIFALTSCEEN
jgi:hypothetical protein